MRKITKTITKEMFGEHYDEEYDGKYIGDWNIREWTFGEKEDILELSSDQEVDTETNDIRLKLKSAEWRILTALTCVRSAPQKVTRKYIRDMPNSIAKVMNDAISYCNEEFDIDEPSSKK